MVKTKQRKVKDAIKTGKATKIEKAGGVINQFDEASAGAGAVQYDENETQTLITGKMVERIQAQFKLRELFLDTQYYYQELFHLEQIYKNYENNKDVSKEYIEIPKWMGIQMPKSIVACEFQNKQHRYKGGITSMQAVIGRLKGVGFTSEDIKNVKQGTIIKDHKQMEDMETRYEDKSKKSDKG